MLWRANRRQRASTILTLQYQMKARARLLRLSVSCLLVLVVSPLSEKTEKQQGRRTPRGPTLLSYAISTLRKINKSSDEQAFEDDPTDHLIADLLGSYATSAGTFYAVFVIPHPFFRCQSPLQCTS
jgi:hypothetical protein